MLPLTLDDLLPLAEFSARRREFFESHRRYIDRYRRVRLGPRVALIFENRQTLWFRVQEILRVARLADPVRVQEELDLYNRLLPGPDNLQAALLLDAPDAEGASEEWSSWPALSDDALQFVIGSMNLPARLVTCRPEDLCVGASHWTVFPFGPESRRLLANIRMPAYFEITLGSYRYKSGPLNEDVRQSLFDDLKPTERDAA